VKARTLVVDDALAMREHTTRMLEAEGFRVVGEVGDGQEAVDAFQTLEPDLVTMDLLLPTCSGVAAIRQIRALDPEARVLVTSARGQEALVMEALHAGARDWIVKPPDRHRLIHVLKRILSGS
jgi:two-component system chemotaxis response regulator CheY